jgi:hypothetical protein
LFTNVFVSFCVYCLFCNFWFFSHFLSVMDVYCRFFFISFGCLLLFLVSFGCLLLFWSVLGVNCCFGQF